MEALDVFAHAASSTDFSFSTQGGFFSILTHIPWKLYYKWLGTNIPSVLQGSSPGSVCSFRIRKKMLCSRKVCSTLCFLQWKECSQVISVHISMQIKRSRFSHKASLIPHSRLRGLCKHPSTENIYSDCVLCCQKNEHKSSLCFQSYLHYGHSVLHSKGKTKMIFANTVIYCLACTQLNGR